MGPMQNEARIGSSRSISGSVGGYRFGPAKAPRLSAPLTALGRCERSLRERIFEFMSFDVAAEAYDGFMGRYSRQLSSQLADLASVRAGQRVLDVGCGTGALTSELVTRLGAKAVAAVDPSEPFVAATRERHPGVDVRRSPAEHLPFPNAGFDAALAQLVVHFMKDPVVGLAEMGRVTRRDGIVAACVWDHGGGEGPLRIFWDAARTLDPKVDDESHTPAPARGTWQSCSRPPACAGSNRQHSP
jgi:SAM-dependent methyltransferase